MNLHQFVILSMILVVRQTSTQQPPRNERMEKYVEQCLTEHSLTKQMLQDYTVRMQKGILDHEHAVEYNSTYGCFFHCVYQKDDAFDEQGGIKVDRYLKEVLQMRPMLSKYEEWFRKEFQKIRDSSIATADPCLKAFQIYNRTAELMTSGIICTNANFKDAGVFDKLCHNKEINVKLGRS